jgi:N-methylhydantoinase B
VQRSYIPGATLDIDPSVRLHEGRATEIDPVTYEIVRYSLLNINLEHTALLQKLAVSQLVILARDYQTTLMTEVGEVVFVGPGVQFFANASALCVQYTLEHRSKNPGIGPGDMFLANDCFIGASHQMDVSLLAPVFIDGEVFCWVTNTLHYQDVGGTAIGGWCHDAQDAWHEPLHWPPIKLVEHAELRDDIERLFVRQSRFPVTVGMDLRAAIASAEAARGKIGELVGRYGTDTVKGVMRGTQDAAERLFAERLRPIPDGRWSHRFHSEGALPGDPGVYTMRVNITKLGDRLVVDNDGTDPQVGALNMTFAGFAGAALAGIMAQTVPDVAGAFGGAYRRVTFRPKPGTILCADYPAAVSTAVFPITMTLNAVSIAVAKMLSCGDAETRMRALGSTYPHSGGTMPLAGVDPTGTPWVSQGAEVMLGSFGGTPTRDGMDFGGLWWMPGGTGPNVEDLEAAAPLIYLYRRGLPSGLDGAGRHRGGVGIIYAIWLRSGQASIQFALGESFPAGAGVMGSAPGSRARAVVVSDSDTLARLKESRIPVRRDELDGELTELPWTTLGYPIKAGDVIEGVFSSMAGYGDPLLRSPEAVLADVHARIVNPEVACRVYGVVLAQNEIDQEATSQQRLAVRRERLGGREPGDQRPPPVGSTSIGEILHLVDGRWWCNGADLGSADANYKHRAMLIETPIRCIGDEFATPFHAVADRMIFREFVCPITGYRIDTELALRDQPPLHDICIAR